jgi:hypothetical protein
MRRQLASFAIVQIAMTGSGIAAQTQPPSTPGDCYEIINPLRGGAGLILLNRCDGSTWMLTRDPLLGIDGRPNRSSTFAWHPLQMAKDGPLLFDIAPPALTPPPKPNVPNSN